MPMVLTENLGASPQAIRIIRTRDTRALSHRAGCFRLRHFSVAGLRTARRQLALHCR
ncbi:hypothetical protein CHELA20_52291 [Hyphomicrobiales bacterium]|nr:hypothetical protein CHELA20_52291 [Hyphomicrobiales bacterium]